MSDPGPCRSLADGGLSATHQRLIKPHGLTDWRPCRSDFTRQTGFTLIELLITLVVIGVGIALVTINGLPNERQGLRFEAERLAQLLSLAREEAQVRGAPIRLSADELGYRFQILRDRQWRPVLDDQELRDRQWQAPTTLTLVRADGRRELEFGRDPVDSPFALNLSRDGATVQLKANGLGLFEVGE